MSKYIPKEIVLNNVEIPDGVTILYSTWKIVDAENTIVHYTEVDEVNLLSKVFTDVFEVGKKYYVTMSMVRSDGPTIDTKPLEVLVSSAEDTYQLYPMPAVVDTPVITIEYTVDNVPTNNIKFTSSAIAVAGNATHDYSNWWLTNDSNEVIWDSFNDQINKTEIVVTNVDLKTNKLYTMHVVYHGTNRDASGAGSITFKPNKFDELELYGDLNQTFYGFTVDTKLKQVDSDMSLFEYKLLGDEVELYSDSNTTGVVKVGSYSAGTEVPQVDRLNYYNKYHKHNILQETTISDITGWSTGTALPGAISYSQTIVTNSRVYILGGFTTGGDAVATVYTAPINTDGTLGAWTTGTPLPGALPRSQAIVTKNRVYLLGGHSGTYTATVYTAPINTDGTLGTWTTGISLPGPLGHSQAIVTKSRVYLLGGRNDTTHVSTVYTAPINTDGTLGAWTTGTPLPGPLGNSQAIVTKSRVYLLSGNNGTTNVSTVYTAPINTDGTLGAWTTGTSLPGVLSNNHAVVTKSRVYLLGGYNGSVYTSTVYTAPINADGTLGAWTTGTSLPGALGHSQAIVTKSRVYLLGGYTGSAYVSTVYTAPFADGWEITSNSYEIPPTIIPGSYSTFLTKEYSEYTLSLRTTINSEVIGWKDIKFIPKDFIVESDTWSDTSFIYENKIDVLDGRIVNYDNTTYLPDFNTPMGKSYQLPNGEIILLRNKNTISKFSINDTTGIFTHIGDLYLPQIPLGVDYNIFSFKMFDTGDVLIGLGYSDYNIYHYRYDPVNNGYIYMNIYTIENGGATIYSEMQRVDDIVIFTTEGYAAGTQDIYAIDLTEQILEIGSIDTITGAIKGNLIRIDNSQLLLRGGVDTTSDAIINNELSLLNILDDSTPLDYNVLDIFSDGSSVLAIPFTTDANDIGGIYNGVDTNVVYTDGWAVLNGTNAYIGIPNTKTLFGSNYTIAFTLKRNSTGNGVVFTTRYNGSGIGIQFAGDTLLFGGNVGGIAYSMPWLASDLTREAEIVYCITNNITGGGILIVDNIVVATVNTGASVTPHQYDISIGREETAGNYCAMSIKNLRIFSTNIGIKKATALYTGVLRTLLSTTADSRFTIPALVVADETMLQATLRNNELLLANLYQFSIPSVVTDYNDTASITYTLPVLNADKTVVSATDPFIFKTNGGEDFKFTIYLNNGKRLFMSYAKTKPKMLIYK